MNKMRWAVAAILAFSLAGAPAVYAAQSVSEDNVFDRVGDWFATLGKGPNERDAIIAQRRAERLGKRTGEVIVEDVSRVGEAGRRGAQQVGEALERSSERTQDGVTDPQTNP